MRFGQPVVALRLIVFHGRPDFDWRRGVGALKPVLVREPLQWVAGTNVIYLLF